MSLSGTGFTFNWIHSSVYYLLVKDYNLPVTPTINDITVQMHGRPGARRYKKEILPRNFSFECEIEVVTFEEQITISHQLGAWLYQENDCVLTLDESPDLFCWASYVGESPVKQTEYGRTLSLPFTCIDPFVYAIIPDSIDQSVASVDMTYILNNAGHVIAYPVVTVTFNAAQSHLYIFNTSITDNRFDISKSFEIDDELEIDCKNGTIKLNGVYSPAGFGDGGTGLAKWLKLLAGDNVIQVGTDDETIDVDVNISFNKVYYY